VDIGVRGARNVLIGLDMLQEKPVASDAEQIVVEESSWPKTEHGGLMYNACELGAKVKKGEKLGVLKDIAGRVIEEVYAPYDSVILDTRYQPTTYPGDWTYHCGKL
jgi:predicted deacylase